MLKHVYGKHKVSVHTKMYDYKRGPLSNLITNFKKNVKTVKNVLTN